MRYSSGDVVWADLDLAQGHEQRKRRPLIVVSNDKFNARCNLSFTIPITSADSGYPLHLDVGEVPAEDGGKGVHGFAEVEQLKSLDLDARNAKLVGHIDSRGMDKIIEVLLGCIITDDMMIVSGSY